MSKIRVRYWVVALSLALSGAVTACGGSSSDGNGAGAVDGSCTMTETITLSGGQSYESSFCIEANGLTPTQVNQLEQTCSSTIDLPDAGLTQTSTFSRAPCSRDGVVAGCRLTVSGVTETLWYYSDAGGYTTADLVKQVCVQQGGTTLNASGQPLP